MPGSWTDAGANSLSYDTPKAPSVNAATAIGQSPSTIGTVPSAAIGKAPSAGGTVPSATIGKAPSAIGSLPKPPAPSAAPTIRQAAPAKPAMPGKPMIPPTAPGLAGLSARATPASLPAGSPTPPWSPTPPSNPAAAPGINGLESQASHTAASATPSVLGTMVRTGLGALNYTSPTSFAIGTGMETLNHGLDREGSNQIHQDAMGKSYAGNAVNNLLTAPHSNASRILDASATTGYNTAQQGLRQLSLDPQIHDRQQQQASETQQAMARGQATQQQIQDAQMRLRREISEQKADNSLRPWLWGM